MFYVYYLRSLTNFTKTYVGFTHDVQQRLGEHNIGESIYTSQFRPWTLIAYFAFDQEGKVRTFEKYLKTNAGKMFLKRHTE